MNSYRNQFQPCSNLTAAIKKQIKNESDKDIIDKLDIPAGLKELLVSHRFTIEQLLNMKSSDIADTLGIGRHCPTDAHIAHRRNYLVDIVSGHIL